MASIGTACGGRIRIGSDKQEKIQLWPNIREALTKVIHRVKLPDDGSTFFVKEIVFDDVIGDTSCVPANSEAPMLFAVRNKKNRASRVVINTPKIPTKSFSVLATKSTVTGDWWLVDYYFGERAPREPSDPYFLKPDSDLEELSRSLEFWESHALVYNPFNMGDYFVSTWEKQAPALFRLR